MVALLCGQISARVDEMCGAVVRPTSEGIMPRQTLVRTQSHSVRSRLALRLGVSADWMRWALEESVARQPTTRLWEGPPKKSLACIWPSPSIIPWVVAHGNEKTRLLYGPRFKGMGFRYVRDKRYPQNSPVAPIDAAVAFPQYSF